MLLKNKTIVLGVTGGIAAYKALEVTSSLKKLGADVKVIMTRSATEFIQPLSFQSLSQNMVATDLFTEPKVWEIQHISLAKAADVLAILPCTANVIGKIASGIADDLLTTTVMATKAPVLIAPAMNTNMYQNPIVQSNMDKLKGLGYQFVNPASGRLACGDSGEGKLADTVLITDKITALALLPERDLTGKRILVTAGATREAIDPVRYITNHSTGKMGFALARAAYLRGAEVTLVAGANSCARIDGVRTLTVTTADEMYETVMQQAPAQDIMIKAAAVADFKPELTADHKIKKSGGLQAIPLSPTRDILAELGRQYGGKKILVGFCMETQNLLENAQRKLDEKHADLIVANRLNEPGAGFGTDTNIVTLLRKGSEPARLELGTKFEVANKILDRICTLT